MDVCPHPFQRLFSLPPSPNVTKATVVPPFPTLDIDFDKNMDTTVLPDVNNMIVTLPTGPETPSAPSWTSPTRLNLTISAGGLPGTFEIIAQDTNLRGSDGSVVKPRQLTALSP